MSDETPSNVEFDDDPQAYSEADGGPLPVVDALQLLAGKREIHLDFQGTRYRLRVTRRGKLILQK